jgi:hypothetical protein
LAMLGLEAVDGHLGRVGRAGGGTCLDRPSHRSAPSGVEPGSSRNTSRSRPSGRRGTLCERAAVSRANTGDGKTTSFARRRLRSSGRRREIERRCRCSTRATQKGSMP